MHIYKPETQAGQPMYINKIEELILRYDRGLNICDPQANNELRGMKRSVFEK